MAVPPAETISAAAASAAVLLRSAIITFAPSRAKACAISLPMPLAAPVTMATLSWKRLICVSSFTRGLGCEVVVDDFAEIEREVGNQVHTGDHLAHWQIGHRRQRMRMQLQ